MTSVIIQSYTFYVNITFYVRKSISIILTCLFLNEKFVKSVKDKKHVSGLLKEEKVAEEKEKKKQRNKITLLLLSNTNQEIYQGIKLYYIYKSKHATLFILA